jgi:predicted nucleic acid-binding protein
MDTIVLDAGPLLADRPLKKPTTRALLEACARKEIRVLVPRVVVEEVVNAATGSFRSDAKDVRKVNDHLKNQLPSPNLLPEIDVDHLTDEFRQHFETELTRHGVEIVEHDTVEHAEIVARDLAQRKPFDESGRGYRDTLIWHVVKNVAEESVIFVTGNTKDFADPDDESRLHPDLAEEVSHPFGLTSTTLAGSIPDVAKQLGQLRDDLREEVLAAVEAEPHALATGLFDYLSLALPYGLDGRTLAGRVTDARVEGVYYAWGVVTAVVSATVEYEYSGTLGEWEMEELDPNLDVNLVEWLADSHTAVVAGEGSAEVLFTVAFDPSDGTIDLLDADPA